MEKVISLSMEGQGPADLDSSRDQGPAGAQDQGPAGTQGPAGAQGQGSAQTDGMETE